MTFLTKVTVKNMIEVFIYCSSFSFLWMTLKCASIISLFGWNKFSVPWDQLYFVRTILRYLAASSLGYSGFLYEFVTGNLSHNNFYRVTIALQPTLGSSLVCSVQVSLGFRQLCLNSAFIVTQHNIMLTYHSKINVLMA